jgi:cell division septation protein DedD
MAEDVLTDDQSHYEVSLTAGQAFLAFVLLLLSLAASFAFGLLLGRGQGDDRPLTRKQDAAVVNEVSPAPAKASAREVAVKDDDFKQAPAPAPTVTEEKTPVWVPASAGAVPAKASTHTEAKVQAEKPRSEPDVPHFAQLLSTSDQKTAESLAAKLIDAGFTSSYVERTITEKGTVYRVRTKFASEAEARAAEGKLKAFSKDVWITK